MRRTIFIIAALLAFICAAAPALTYSGRVSRIVDGDTLIVLDARGAEHKVRVDMIDAPELDQPFGYQSARRLRSAVGSDLFMVTTNRRDQYGRELGRIILNGSDVGLTLVRSGYAWFFDQMAARHSEAENALYAAAQSVARQKRVGLWQGARPEAPWKHRAAKQ
jgi:endonuclease YncB( thermonuclease family)